MSKMTKHPFHCLPLEGAKKICHKNVYPLLGLSSVSRLTDYTGNNATFLVHFNNIIEL